jgi:hypothetical protein
MKTQSKKSIVAVKPAIVGELLPTGYELPATNSFKTVNLDTLTRACINLQERQDSTELLKKAMANNGFAFFAIANQALKDAVGTNAAKKAAALASLPVLKNFANNHLGKTDSKSPFAIAGYTCTLNSKVWSLKKRSPAIEQAAKDRAAIKVAVEKIEDIAHRKMLAALPTKGANDAAASLVTVALALKRQESDKAEVLNQARIAAIVPPTDKKPQADAEKPADKEPPAQKINPQAGISKDVKEWARVQVDQMEKELSEVELIALSVELSERVKAYFAPAKTGTQ